MDMKSEIISVKLIKKIKDTSVYLGNIIYDTNEDAQSLINQSATHWELKNGTVILAPDGWN